MDGVARMAEGVIGVVLSAERRHNMSAALLKRKLRNFPIGELTLRVLGS
jgi:hypothetical protein